MKKIAWMIAAAMTAALFLSACVLAPAPAAVTATPEATAAPEVTVAPEATAAPEATSTEAAESESDTLEFSLTTLTGHTLDETVFSDHKLVMVNYWATWCGPCVGEIPDLVKIHNDYADQGFTIVGVLIGDDDIEGAKKFIEDQKVNYPVVMPEDFFLDQSAGISAIPTTMFFDSTGKQVGQTIVGASSYEDWAGLIDLLLDQVS
jgi:thiol-disulfide isomerase/thioredoxin